MSHLTLKYDTKKGKEVTLDLELNRELIPEGHFIHYQLPNGQGYAQKNFTLQDVDHCHYKVRLATSLINTSLINQILLSRVTFEGTGTRRRPSPLVTEP